MPKRILITGSSGYLGSKVVSLLLEKGNQVFGLDVCEPKKNLPGFDFIKGSVTDRAVVRCAFEHSRPDCAVHLAFVVKTTHDKHLEESVAIDGTMNFLDSCAWLRVSKVVFLSSVAAYGAHDDNDVPLTESSPLRGVEGYGYSRLKAKADKIAQEFIMANKWCEFVILRPCLFVGPNTDNNFFDVLKYPIVPQIRDLKGVRDPKFQFIDEDDMAACLVAAIEKPVRGIYNVAGEGETRFSELVRNVGKKTIAVPASIIYPITAILWRFHLVTSPPAQLDFIRYPWVMDVSKMKKDLFVPQKTTFEAWNSKVKGATFTGSAPLKGNCGDRPLKKSH